MKTYARIQDGFVAEIVAPATYDSDFDLEADGKIHRAGEEIPIEERFHADIVKVLVNVTGLNPMPQERWAFDGEVFMPPQQA